MQQPLLVDLDRIALLPAVELAFRPVLGRVGALMAAVAVGHAFDQRRPAAGARLVVGRLRRAIDHVGVVAVDDTLPKRLSRTAKISAAMIPSVSRFMVVNPHRAES